MTAGTNRIGRIGEQLAARYLTEHGLEIVARNWRGGGEGLRGELDLVARDGGCLVVVEVKTRRGVVSVDDALVAVGPRKRRQLRLLAGAFLAAADVRVERIRIDVVAVTWPAGGGGATVTHLVDAC
jgi:putative endonuclease